MFERDYRDLAFIPRWGIMPVNHRQSVAEHSFYVAVYAIHIINFYMDKGYDVEDITKNTLIHATLHDRSEAFMSDIPGPVKRSISGKEIRNQYEIFMNEKTYNLHYDILPEAEAIVKVADLMDEYGFWMIEEHMGNNFYGRQELFTQIAIRLTKAIHNLPYLTDVEKDEMFHVFAQGMTKDKTIPENSDDVAA